MKPRVFLSHSKKDKAFIEKLANDLRSCGIDSWYDEWEIPPGESIRKKIFEDGIPNCDSFFIYLTENSYDSYWVKRELDSAVIRESEQKTSYMIMFVDNDTVRDKLSYDLKSANIPVLNPQEYITPLGKIISKAWQGFFKKQANDQAGIWMKEKLALDQQILEKDREIFEYKKKGFVDLSVIKQKLESKNVIFGDVIYNSYLATFNVLMTILTDAVSVYNIRGRLRKIIAESNSKSPATIFTGEDNLADFVGELVIQGVIKQVWIDEQNGVSYTLTDLGIELARSF